MTIRGAIFDLDGTLLDSMSLWATLGEDYLRTRGLSPRSDVNEVIRCMSLYQAACYFRREYGVPDPPAAIMEQVNALVARAYRDEIPAKPGAAAFLQRLQRQGVLLCVATAADRAPAEAALTRCGLRPFFSHLFTCTEVGHGKDEPVIYQQAAAALGTPPAETAVFEDTLAAAKTAKTAGFRVVGVWDAFEPQAQQLRALADDYLESFLKTEEWEL